MATIESPKPKTTAATVESPKISTTIVIESLKNINNSNNRVTEK